MLSRAYHTDAEIRKKQINTLKIFNANVIEVQEGCEYQVLFQSGGKDVTLHISLNSEFPKSKPVLKVTPILVHQWINTDGEIISAPGLLNFTIHSDLGRVVRAIIREFEKTPPPVQDSYATSPSIPNRIDNDLMGRASPNYFSQNFSPPIHSNFTANQLSTFPELSTMSMEELHFLHNCPERREEFLDNLPQNKENNKLLDDLILQIEELAVSNLGKQKELGDLHKQIDDRIEEITKLVLETENLNVTYQNLSEEYSPKSIKNKLLIAAEKVNNESDKIAEQFLEGKLDVDKFVIEYLNKRTLGQARKTKEEKLTQQLHNLERAGF